MGDQTQHVADPLAGHELVAVRLVIDARALGLAVHELADRDSGTDPALGLSELVELGDTVAAGQPLAELHVRTEDQRRWFSERVLKAIEIL